MRIFDVLGPVMIGPSSSHTAGAVRIGWAAGRLLGDTPALAEIGLFGSFSMTGRGHGTDAALVAGLLGMKPDDSRIPDSFQLAKDAGLDYRFSTIHLRNAHPNTVEMKLTGVTGRQLTLIAESIGGGRIYIRSLDGIAANFNCETNTLIVHNLDESGHVSAVSTALANRHINIATMQLYRDNSGNALMVLECDQRIPAEIATWLLTIDGITKITIFNRED